MLSSAPRIPVQQPSLSRRLSRSLCSMWAAAAIVLAGGSVCAGGGPELHPAMAENAWTVIAHQGGNQLWPGNTMTAFEGAVALGAGVLEMDVHQTADGEIVVIHDETVDRTTDGSGAVREMTLAEIRKLDAGYHWPLHTDSTEPPYRGRGIEIPRLEEVLQAFPGMPMVIEIKQAEPSMFEAFGNLLRRYNRAGDTIVASFHPEVIAEFREAFPEFATAGVEPEIRRFFVLNKALLGRLYRPRMDAFQVPERFGDLRVVTPRFVRVARAKGIAVHVWTVNEYDDMVRLLEAGVDGIMTDRPDLLVQAVQAVEAKAYSSSNSVFQ